MPNMSPRINSGNKKAISASRGKAIHKSSAQPKSNIRKSPQDNQKQKIHVGEFDKPFFILVLVLMVIGMVMMFSASYYWGLTKNNDGFYYVKKQIAVGGLGVFAMIAISFMNYHLLNKIKLVIALFIGSVVLLAYTSFFGIIRNGARRWIKIGVEFQPSEITKFAVIVLFAYIIAQNYNKMKKFRYGILPFFAVLGIVAVLLMIQPHLSGTILVCSIGIVMMFVGGSRVKYLLGTGLVGVLGLGAAILYKVMQNDMGYFKTRIQSWIDPFADVSAKTWQTCQSLIAIGSGGLFGMGFGESRQKFLYLPESQNDFVFSIVCEELGLIGALLVILLFILFTLRGFYIASKAPDKFGMMLAVGLTAQISIQALFNIAVVTNTIPNTGISLPFFSFGGTALAMQLAQMGVILNISRQSLIED